jgi:drug/metabolite transporter (DMT)-like permease
MPTSARISPLDWSLLIALSLLWGGSFFFVGVAVKALPPFTIVLLRVAIAATALHVVLRVTRAAMPWDRGTWLAFFGMGLLNNAIPFSLIVWGQTQIASGLASILNATTPLFTVLVAHLLTADERLSKGRIAGVLIGFAGVIVLIGPQALAGLGKDVAAQLAVLGAAVSYGFAAIFGRRFKRMGVPPLATAAGQVTASSLLLLPVALLVDRPWTLVWPAPSVWGAIMGLALLSTALAYVVFFRILASAGAVNLSLVTFLIPPSAILLGVALLGERLQATDFLGMALIGLGLAAIDGRLASLLPHVRARAPER